MNDPTPVVRVISDPAEARSRLRELGLSIESLRDALEYGFSYRADCTGHDPIPGMMMWEKTVRGLRDQLVPQGWKVDNRRNLPQTVNPADDLAIVVRAGNDETGNPVGHPRPLCEQGPATRGLLIDATQPPLFNLAVEESSSPRRRIWILLYRCGRRWSDLRAELSQPYPDADGEVGGWHQRIILPLENDDDLGGALEPLAPIDVPVRMKDIPA